LALAMATQGAGMASHWDMGNAILQPAK